MNIQPFTTDIPQETLDDLHERLAQTLWPDEAEGTAWAYGISQAYTQLDHPNHLNKEAKGEMNT